MIEINGEAWRVFLVSPNHPALRRPNGTAALGSCDDILKAIFINQNVSHSLFKRILSHELVHAYMFSHKITLGTYQEEARADMVATYGEDIINLTNLFIKNKKWETYN